MFILERKKHLASLSPRKAKIKEKKAIKAAAAEGRKYGCSRRSCIFPNVSGHLDEGRDRTPPRIGLWWHQIESLSEVICHPEAHPIVVPILHITGIKANASAIFVGSVICTQLFRKGVDPCIPCLPLQERSLIRLNSRISENGLRQ